MDGHACEQNENIMLPFSGYKDRKNIKKKHESSI